MNDTYTIYIAVDDIEKDDLVVARHLSAPEAMKIACGYEDGWRVRLDEEAYDTFVHYTGRMPTGRTTSISPIGTKTCRRPSSVRGNPIWTGCSA